MIQTINARRCAGIPATNDTLYHRIQVSAGDPTALLELPEESGLDVHEPPLLDMNGPTLLVGDALTIEPGLYRRDLGGVRIEDMAIVTEDGCTDLNSLDNGLKWS